MSEQSETLAEALASRRLLGFVTLESAKRDTAVGPASTKTVVTAKVGGMKEGATKSGAVKGGGETN